MTIWKRVAEAWCRETHVEIDREKNARHLDAVNKIIGESDTPPSALDAIFGASDDDEEW